MSLRIGKIINQEYYIWENQIVLIISEAVIKAYELPDGLPCPTFIYVTIYVMLL